MGGEATLKNRIKSHPDVGERWYPDILAEIREKQKREREESESKKANTAPASTGKLSLAESQRKSGLKDRFRVYHRHNMRSRLSTQLNSSYAPVASQVKNKPIYNICSCHSFIS